MDISGLGLWDSGSWFVERTNDELAEIEELGVRTLWLGGSPNADLRAVEKVLRRTNRLQVATGIVNVWEGEPSTAAESWARVTAAYPDRFLLGVGVGHRPFVGDRYVRPYEKLVGYLDGLDAGDVPVEGRVIAALGPRALRLSADRAAGTHPYLTTPEHTAQAREIIGQDKLLVPEQKVVLSEDADEARALGRKKVNFYFKLPNYTNNWLRHGFTEDDFAGDGSDRLIDAMVAWGSEDAIRARIEEHRQAGADQVAVQILNSDKIAALRRLAPALLAG